VPPTQESLLEWAREYAEVLQRDMRWVSSEYGSYWQADERSGLPKIWARAIAALNFLATYAGEDSEWTRRGRDLYESKGDRQSTETGVRALGELLLEWADQVDAGVTPVRLAQLESEREVVATDILSQVARLNADAKSHPAASIMLAGTALEIGLRAAAEAAGLELSDDKRPSISTWAHLLRSAELISKQDMKDIEQVGGLRNEAAHGHFGALDRTRARLLEQQVNLLLARLQPS
jgi:hypothetical protein